MNNIVISTKNSKTHKSTNMISLVLIVLVGIVVIAFYSYAGTNTYSNWQILIFLAGLFLVCNGIIMTVIYCIYSSTYLYVFKDRFIGKGIQSLSVKTFNITLEKINDISLDGFWVNIHTICGTYKIMTDKKTARRVAESYKELKG